MTPDHLQERLLGFAEAVCRAVAHVRSGTIARQLTAQLVRSATAPAAIYAEARSAETRRDFIHKMPLCLKELRETQVWLELLRRLEVPTLGPQLGAECGELTAIFVASIKTARRALTPRRHPQR